MSYIETLAARLDELDWEGDYYNESDAWETAVVNPTVDDSPLFDACVLDSLGPSNTEAVVDIPVYEEIAITFS